MEDEEFESDWMSVDEATQHLVAVTKPMTKAEIRAVLSSVYSRGYEDAVKDQ
jgi:hypothetical protein